MTAKTTIIDMERTDPAHTYLNDERYLAVWIGARWDVAYTADGGYELWRKGNYIWTVNSLQTAWTIIEDAERGVVRCVEGEG